MLRKLSIHFAGSWPFRPLLGRYIKISLSARKTLINRNQKYYPWHPSKWSSYLQLLKKVSCWSPNVHENDSGIGKKESSKMLTELWGSSERCLSMQTRVVHWLFCTHSTCIWYIYEVLFLNASCRNCTKKLASLY